MFERHYSGAPWEREYGYCRAIRVGQVVHLAGTTAMHAGEVWAPGDALAQARYCLKLAQAALAEFQLPLSAVYRVRWYLTNIADQTAVGQAHREAFAKTPPVATMLEVKALVRPDLLVEVELEAYAGT
jgi:enamine deaminase RidA (YjgF/YER057c/UK114 family)